jgi:hypothetical protein
MDSNANSAAAPTHLGSGAPPARVSVNIFSLLVLPVVFIRDANGPQ